jgi:hypothetical protein
MNMLVAAILVIAASVFVLIVRGLYLRRAKDARELDDPRLKRVLKRYRKNEEQSESYLDVTALGLATLQVVADVARSDAMISPKQLDGASLTRLSAKMGIPFDTVTFDYFLHTYVRQEFVGEYYRTKGSHLKASPEGGPPETIPIQEGYSWVSVRPENDREHYVGRLNQSTDPTP